MATFPLDELEPGTARRIDVDGVPVAVVRCGDDVYAIGDTCSHAQVSLSEGDVWCDEREIECPKHSSTFDLLTGATQILFHSITREKLKSVAPDIFIRPAVGSFNAMDYFHIAEILAAAEPAKAELKRQLAKALEAKS